MQSADENREKTQIVGILLEITYIVLLQTIPIRLLYETLRNSLFF